MSLDELLNPNVVAIIGASNDPTRIGGRPLAYMKAAGFAGRLIPVNPNRTTVQGLAAAPSVSQIDGQIDYAVIAVPAPLVEDTLRAAAAKGAKCCLVFSSGFAESGAEGAAREASLAAAAQDVGVRLIGPNCLGAFNAVTGFIPCFSTSLDRGVPVAGGLAIASQSGAYGSHIYFLARKRGLDTRYFLTTGNEADVNVAEAIGLMAADEGVQTILAYAEGIKDGPALINALNIARQAQKPVVFMKVGRSQVGAAAAASHTASMAGEDAVYDAIFRQYGAIRARSTEEMLDIAYAAQARRFPVGKRLGIVTISGGAGVLMADDAEEHGLDVPEMPAAAQAELKRVVPFAAVRNPVDTTAQVFNDMKLVSEFLHVMMAQGEYDSLVTFWTSVAGSRAISDRLLEAMRKGVAGFEDKLIIQSLIADDDIVRLYEDAGYPVFEDPTRAIVAIAAMTRIGQAFAAADDPVPTVPAPIPAPAAPLGEAAAKAMLADAGLPMLQDELATDADAAARIAAALDCPLALKIASADITHKTDLGGVALNIAPADAAHAFTDMMTRVAKAVPDAALDGVLIAPMAADGVDCIIGGRIDPVFGPIILVGLGGVYTEVLNDVALRHAPVSPATARQMLDELKGAALLSGARGAAAVDRAALAQAVSDLSLWLAANVGWVESVEVNPMRARPDGCLGLDALIISQQDTHP